MEHEGDRDTNHNWSSWNNYNEGNSDTNIRWSRWNNSKEPEKEVSGSFNPLKN